MLERANQKSINNSKSITNQPDKRSSLELSYFSENDQSYSKPTLLTVQNKSKSRFSVKNRSKQVDFPIIDELNIKILENLPKCSKSKSKKVKKRPVFYQNKKKINIISEVEKTTELLKPDSQYFPKKEATLDRLILPYLNHDDKFLSCSANLWIKRSKNNNNNEVFKKCNSQKLKNDIRLYNYLMLWASIISETCQKLTDDMKIPNSLNILVLLIFSYKFFKFKRFEILVQRAKKKFRISQH